MKPQQKCKTRCTKTRRPPGELLDAIVRLLASEHQQNWNGDDAHGDSDAGTSHRAHNLRGHMPRRFRKQDDLIDSIIQIAVDDGPAPEARIQRRNCAELFTEEHDGVFRERERQNVSKFDSYNTNPHPRLETVQRRNTTVDVNMNDTTELCMEHDGANVRKHKDTSSANTKSIMPKLYMGFRQLTNYLKNGNRQTASFEFIDKTKCNRHTTPKKRQERKKPQKVQKPKKVQKKRRGNGKVAQVSENNHGRGCSRRACTGRGVAIRDSTKDVSVSSSYRSFGSSNEEPMV